MSVKTTATGKITTGWVCQHVRFPANFCGRDDRRVSDAAMSLWHSLNVSSKGSISGPCHARMNLRHRHGVRDKFPRLGPMVYRLLFESSAELIRLTDTPTRLATDSAE